MLSETYYALNCQDGQTAYFTKLMLLYLKELNLCPESITGSANLLLVTWY